MTVIEAIREICACIGEAAQEESLLQAKELVSFVLGTTRESLITRSDTVLTGKQQELLFHLAERRKRGEPVQYLIGEWDFMGFPFYVDSSVLIPRADTELLCENAVIWARNHPGCSCLDLCCGSGCIGISISRMTGIRVVLSDVSEAALRKAAENAKRLNASVEIIQSDLFDEIPERFELIVCNPPYLSGEDMKQRQKELYYEPYGALYGGSDGLDYYRKISGSYRDHLVHGGVLMMEIGCRQADAVSALFPVKEIRKDYAGHPRLVIVEND